MKVAPWQPLLDASVMTAVYGTCRVPRPAALPAGTVTVLVGDTDELKVTPVVVQVATWAASRSAPRTTAR